MFLRLFASWLLWLGFLAFSVSWLLGFLFLLGGFLASSQHATTALQITVMGRKNGKNAMKDKIRHQPTKQEHNS
jgi:predicted RND superfamily exporter protein